MLPHNLLPIKRPLEDNKPVKPTQFYDDVVQHLIPDIVRMEANGIPIDIEQVQILEQTLTDVLSTVKSKLAKNPFIQQYLEQISNNFKVKKENEIQTKLKTFKDYLKPFDIKNKTHRSYVINTYLKEIDREDLILPEWNTNDFKMLRQMVSYTFFENLALKQIQTFMQPTIEKAMKQLAEDKAAAYNKNILVKINDIKQKTLPEFNPSSSVQKRQLFEMLGIESEKETAGGNSQFDRKELERLQKLLGSMLDERTENTEV